MTRIESAALLSNLTDQMNGDELEVLSRFARKIVNGSKKHGPMNLDTDTRDLSGVEFRAEVMDASCYQTMHEIQQERRAARPPVRVSTDPIVASLRELRDVVYPDAAQYIASRDESELP